MKTMTATLASKEFGRFLDTVQHEPVIVTKQNRPVAVTVSFRDWEELIQLRLEHGLRKGLEDSEHGRVEGMSDITTRGRLTRFRERTSSAE